MGVWLGHVAQVKLHGVEHRLGHGHVIPF
ncbi:hypothetical protein F383_13707 [Gossypium arboreum]|uniref:Uncharacterized protein n=1 Tax=Gossypium arboreum TaxID=29729 RepID=A0A0B0PZ05_GOSAR|nr:hypothetical protein F383_13707 [Gossypium arboreum]